MKNLSFFEVFFLILFVALAIGGLLAFSGFLPGLSTVESGVGGTVTLWGTFPERTIIDSITSATKEGNKPGYTIEYSEKDPAIFDRELTEALAEGTGPDMIILPSDLILRHQNKIQALPLESYPLRTFYDTFTDGSRIFLSSSGALALPLVADPLVLYYNKDALAKAGYADVPRFWSQLIDRSGGTSPVERLTAIDARGNVLESAIALGDYSNVRHAKDIFSLLALQAGNTFVQRNVDGEAQVIFGIGQGGAANSNAVSSLSFFTQFSNSTKTTYTWNSSLPDSRTLFGTGKLALYLGFASEQASITVQNAHLNFDVAEVPQRDNSRKISTGRLYGVAVLKQSRNKLSAQRAQVFLSDALFAKTVTSSLNLPAVRRDILSQRATDPYQDIYQKSTISLQTWLDPDPDATDSIFATMVQSTLSGQVDESSAVKRAQTELETLLN